MASGGNSKRASMREGPLAALFRKTEEEGLHGEGAHGPQQQPRRSRRPRSGAAPEQPQTGLPIPDQTRARAASSRRRPPAARPIPSA